jgi:serine protease Do
MKRYSTYISGLMFFSLLLSNPLWAQEKYPRRTPIVEAFQKNKDAVVSITGKQLTRRDDIFGWDMDEYFFFRPRLMATPFLGSGFLLDQRGYIITNAHVVADALEIIVVLSDDTKYEARPIALDRTSDLALLKIEAEKSFPTVTLGRSDDLMIGETVLAIGNPFGYQHTLTDGIISAVHRDMAIEDRVFPSLIQISAPINPGNSGGALLNINGEVIGINTAIRRAAEGIGFAIPVDLLRDNLPRMIGMKIESELRINLGMTVGDLGKTAGTNSSEPGVLVLSVRAESAAAQAGVQAGDVITAVDGKTMGSAIDFYLNLLEQSLGGKLNLEIRRKKDITSTTEKGEHLRIEMVLRERPKPDGAQLARRFFGIKVAGITDREARNYGGAVEKGTVKVVSVEQDSPADNAGIEAGDLIIGLNQIVVRNLEELAYKMEMLTEGSLVKINLRRLRRSQLGIRLWDLETNLRVRSSRGNTSERVEL